jgi:hypothetical protein
MIEIKPPIAKQVESFLTPESFLRAAKTAHPAFRYAIAVAGIFAIIVAFTRFGIGYAALAFGSIALIALMALFLLFAQASRLSGTNFDLPAKVLIWFVLLVAMVVVTFLVSSAFFNVPLPLRTTIVGSLEPTPVKVETRALPSPSTDAVLASLFAAEIGEIYKTVGYQLLWLNEWARPPTFQTLRINNNQIVGTNLQTNATVGMSIDPKLLPPTQQFDLRSAKNFDLVKLGEQAGQAIVRFHSHYDRYRQALTALTSNPPDQGSAIINAHAAAREVIDTGRIALCALGSTPPHMSIGMLELPTPNCAAAGPGTIIGPRDSNRPRPPG